MKELEVKAMLEDSRIPEPYKLGGRLSSEFLDGVDYAEQRIMEKGVEVWLARDPDGWLAIFKDKPLFVYNNIGSGAWRGGEDRTGGIHIKTDYLTEVTHDNSPVKARIILDEFYEQMHSTPNLQQV
jgi:hypothetical protein